jgi:SAM-dependent methyltransferase
MATRRGQPGLVASLIVLIRQVSHALILVPVSARNPRRPAGTVTRGTTAPNRLRRVDRWMTHALRPVLRAPTHPPVVVDLGYGATPVTTVELRHRMAAVRPDVQVLGLEISPERVAAAQPYAAPPALDFALGGFEVPVPQPATVVRAFNVLRQYDEEQVPHAWHQVVRGLAPGGVLVDGTSNEVGRLASWVRVHRSAAGVPEPRSLTLAWRLSSGLDRPSAVAERLPKVLIHRNVPGEPVHHALTALDRAWDRAAPLASYGTRQRFRATAQTLREEGWPVLDGPSRWRLGELTLDWSAVAPR